MVSAAQVGRERHVAEPWPCQRPTMKNTALWYFRASESTLQISFAARFVRLSRKPHRRSAAVQTMMHQQTRGEASQDAPVVFDCSDALQRWGIAGSRQLINRYLFIGDPLDLVKYNFEIFKIP